MNIAICDDTHSYFKIIKQVVQKWSKNNNLSPNIHCFDNGDDLITKHQETPFDIIILDIIMPLLSGIDTAKEIRNIDKITKIIFITSSPEFAVTSYSLKANNYLLKPFADDELYAALDDVAESIKKFNRFLIVKGLDATYKVSLSEIEYLESQNKLLVIYLSNGKIIKTSEPMYYFSSKLLIEDGFYKCHRSYIINLNKIDNFTSKEVKMQSGCTIPIARSVSKIFNDIYFSFTFKD